MILLSIAVIPVLLTNLKKAEPTRIEHVEEMPSHFACPYQSAFYNSDPNAPLSYTHSPAAIVSHHLLAGDLINSTLSKLDPGYDTVILVGPNHRNIGKYPIQTSAYAWKTVFGTIEPDPELINKIKDLNNIGVLEDYFNLEHSVCGLVTFVKKYFPQAKIVPIILRSDARQEDVLAIANKLSGSCSNCLVIASTDFSHEVPDAQATKNDQLSMEILRERDFDNISEITSDCNQCFWFLSGFLHENDKFFVDDSSNSFKLSGEHKESVTSYITGYYSPDLISVLFTGDLMFDRYIRQVADDHGYDFILENMRDFLTSKDLVVTNLEGPITDFDSISVGTKFDEKNNYLFTFDSRVAEMLRANNIGLVSIGNNHILNFGQDGLDQTFRYLEKYGIEYFGNTGLSSELPTSAVINIRGVKIGFVNYNQFVENGLESALENLSAIKKKADLVFLYTHWGNEYAPVANTEMEKLAHYFIENGADAIIGSHPHVVQQQEEYAGKYIFYSLGNFVADQYLYDLTKNGLMVEAVIDPHTHGVDYAAWPVVLKENGQTVPGF